MLAAAEAEARKNNWNVAIAIVDAGGSLILFQNSTIPTRQREHAIGKARTAVNLTPHKALEDSVAGGRSVLSHWRESLRFRAGACKVDGKLIGAVGVSGVMSGSG